MGTRPHPLVERLAGALLPPARREDVLGDLHERCTSMSGYVLEAAATIPLVVWSQVRRATGPSVLVAQAAALVSAMVIAAWLVEPATAARSGLLLRLLLPAGLALVTLALHDAYADANEAAPEPLVDASIAALNGAIVQAGLLGMRAALALPMSVTLAWAALSVVLVAAVRAESSKAAPPEALAGAATHPGDPLDRAMALHARLTGSETATLVAVGIAGYFLSRAFAHWLAVAAAAIVIGAVGWQKWRGLVLPDAVNADGSRPAGRTRQLECRRDTMRYWTAWHRPLLGAAILFALPGVLAPWIGAPARTHGTALPLWTLNSLLWTRMFLLGRTLSHRAERAFQQAIDGLETR